MRHKRFLLLYSVIFVWMAMIGSVAWAQQNNSRNVNTGWVGEYELEYSEPVNSGGFAPTITYTVRVFEENGRLAAEFIADGTQASDDFRCSVVADDKKLSIYFQKDVSEYKLRQSDSYKKGDLLGSLVKVVSGGKTKYLHRGGKAEIYPPKIAARHPVYFKKKRRTRVA